jgi:hypothetical protein
VASRAEQLAAIDTLDHAVVASGGEVITFADRKAAIAELDEAVDAASHTFPRLSKAIAEAQRVRAWDADEGFTAALAAGTVEIETNDRGYARGPFVAWVRHRYDWKAAYAGHMERAGRVIELTEGTTTVVPSSERQIRPLTKLLKVEDADEAIPRVWEQAVREAEADRKPQSVARYVDRIIKAEFPELTKRTFKEDDADLDRKIRQFRTLFRHLYGRMNQHDFAERVIAWMNEEVGE